MSRRHIGIDLLVAYLAVYASLLFAMHRTGTFDIVEPLFIITTFGGGLSLAAWLSTLRALPLDYPVVSPKSELATIAACLLPVVAFVTWGMGLLQRHFPSPPANAFVVLAIKLAVFVILPALIMRAQFGYGWRQLAPISARPTHLIAAVGMSWLLLGLQALFGRGLRDISQAHLPTATLLYGLPLVFVWLALEAGIVEEFFFRVLLQTRLAAVLKSELGAIVLTSLIFGLAHAPGIYLRTALTQEGLHNPSPLMAVGYSIIVISVTGFFLGVLWSRTRNFAVVVVVHAAGDLLPNLLPVLRSLRLLS